MHQTKYQPISTIKVSAKEQFQWVKCPSKIDPDRYGILQSYSLNSDLKILELVQWEIDRLLPLSHPNLQSVIDVFTTDNSLHIVQELEQWECAAHKVPYTPVQAKILLREIIPVLIYLHNQGITHGNISPETIVVNDRNQNILTNFLVIADLITEAGGDTYPRLRSQLAQIPVLNIPTGQEWDLYSLGVTTIALLTNKDYQYLYDPISRQWKWESYVDCSEELARAIDRLLGQEKKPLSIELDTLEAPILPSDRETGNHQVSNMLKNGSTKINPDLYRMIIGLLIFGTIGLLGYLIWDKFQNRFIESNSIPSLPQAFQPKGTLTVGYINRTQARARSQSPVRDYPKFKSYLEAELRKKYGNGVKVELESVMTNREAQNRIEQKKWDIAFTSLATNSIIAEDNKYEFIARMSANEDPYRDVCFFVMNNSKIKSIKDFTPDRTIALPSDDSPMFVMPLYDLYGKRIRVSLGNNLTKIQEKVKSGEANIGVDFCKIISKNPQLRPLSPNRIIPVGGVFLSPKIEKTADRDYIKQAIAKAPDEIQVKANYTPRSVVNYTQFRRINDRANKLLNCVDFTRNPVDFYCKKPPQQ